MIPFELIINYVDEQEDKVNLNIKIFISLDDNLLRIFGDDKIKNQLKMGNSRTKIPRIQLFRRSITAAQKKWKIFTMNHEKFI